MMTEANEHSEDELSQHQEAERNSLYDDFLLLHSSPLKQELLVIGFLLLVFILFRFQAVLNFFSFYIGGWERDAGLYSWLIKSNLRDLFSEPWFNTKAFYPYTRTLAWSDNFILPSLVASPFLAIGIPLVAVYNALLVGASLLNGYLTYRVAFRLSGHLHASAISGTMFMTSSYLCSQLGHPQLQFAFWIPLSLLSFFPFMAKPTLRRALPLGFCVLAAFLTTVYYALFCVLFIASFALSVAVLKPWRYRLGHWAKLAIGSGIGVAPILFFVFPYLDVRSVFGSRGIFESYYFSATGLSYLSSGIWNLLYSFSSSFTHAEAHLFPGIVAILLSGFCMRRLTEAKQLKRVAVPTLSLFLAAAVLSVYARSQPLLGYLAALCSWGCLLFALWWMRVLSKLEYKLGAYILTNRDLIAAFFFCALLFFCISLGPLGNPEKHQYAFGVFRLFYEIIPGFNSIRAISRIGIVVLFCLSLLVGFGLQSLHKEKLPKGLFATILALILLESFHTTYPLQPEQQAPKVFTDLALEQDSGALIVLPMVDNLKDNQTVDSWGEFAEYNVKVMHWAHETNRHYMNGYSGQRSKIMKEYPRKMSGFPDSRSLSALSLVPDLRYVVYVSHFDPNFSESKFLQALEQHKDELSLISQDAEGNYLIKINPRVLLDGRYFLRVPSYPNHTLHLQLNSPYSDSEAEVKVDLIEEDHFGGAMLASFDLKPSSETQSFAIRLPDAEQRARPFKVSFQAPKSSIVYLEKAWLTR